MLQGSHILENSRGQKKNTVNEEGGSGSNTGQAASAIAMPKVNNTEVCYIWTAKPLRAAQSQSHLIGLAAWAEPWADRAEPWQH